MIKFFGQDPSKKDIVPPVPKAKKEESFKKTLTFGFESNIKPQTPQTSKQIEAPRGTLPFGVESNSEPQAQANEKIDVHRKKTLDFGSDNQNLMALQDKLDEKKDDTIEVPAFTDPAQEIKNLKLDQDKRRRIHAIIESRLGTYYEQGEKVFDSDVIGFDDNTDIVTIQYTEDGTRKEQQIGMNQFFKMQTPRVREKLQAPHREKYPAPGTIQEIADARHEMAQNRAELKRAEPISEEHRELLQEKINALNNAHSREYPINDDGILEDVPRAKLKFDARNLIPEAKIKVDTDGTEGYVTLLSEDGRSAFVDIPIDREYDVVTGGTTDHWKVTPGEEEDGRKYKTYEFLNTKEYYQSINEDKMNELTGNIDEIEAEIASLENNFAESGHMTDEEEDRLTVLQHRVDKFKLAVEEIKTKYNNEITNKPKKQKPSYLHEDVPVETVTKSDKYFKHEWVKASSLVELNWPNKKETKRLKPIRDNQPQQLSV